ncbi:uncharacterized protein AFUA_1G04630 [Aspergillus fumigatus Af293]|uniref:Uncharacterized protein n=2 Tax=Aspergillus fumigatus TaxID=746128 RepID=Q4WJV8_ASPFU|nr:hypothetical protein AFUA_1G04630 [Aspergillus fumigatus Af293]EAL88174.1 hypothetical protein AFUA_1G04630 [Aspergillus fumigatus Af293]EDP55802.1 hypothetical protein AFUB_004980 [Aspergillus fumigatus A1163]
MRKKREDERRKDKPTYYFKGPESQTVKEGNRGGTAKANLRHAFSGANEAKHQTVLCIGISHRRKLALDSGHYAPSQWVAPSPLSGDVLVPPTRIPEATGKKKVTKVNGF